MLMLFLILFLLALSVFAKFSWDFARRTQIQSDFMWVQMMKAGRALGRWAEDSDRFRTREVSRASEVRRPDDLEAETRPFLVFNG